MGTEHKEDLIVRSALGIWDLNIGRLDGVIGRLSDADLAKPVASGRNRAVYLLGHLTAVNDALLPMFKFGPRLHPQLEQTFIKDADDPLVEHDAVTLRAQWASVSSTLLGHFRTLSLEDWLGPHASVTREEFASEPTRNRLSLLLNRAGHVSFHLGQLIFLLPPGSTRRSR